MIFPRDLAKSTHNLIRLKYSSSRKGLNTNNSNSISRQKLGLANRKYPKFKNRV
jgi:hypothetical protein